MKSMFLAKVKNLYKQQANLGLKKINGRLVLAKYKNKSMKMTIIGNPNLKLELAHPPSIYQSMSQPISFTTLRQWPTETCQSHRIHD